MQSIQLLSNSNYRIMGNFWGIKLSQIFVILWLFAKVFPAKFQGMVSFDTAKRSDPRKFSPRKSFFLPIREVFSLESFPLYDTSFNNNGFEFEAHHFWASLLERTPNSWSKRLSSSVYFWAGRVERQHATWAAHSDLMQRCTCTPHLIEKLAVLCCTCL